MSNDRNADLPETRLYGKGQVPVIELSLVNLTVGRAPADPSINAFFIGPVILQVSFDDAAKKQIVETLTGIVLPPSIAGV